ncbi:MAG: hypothetical protein QM739_02425 [Propionivibrio sp.]
MKMRPLAILSALVLANAPCTEAFGEEALGRLFFTPERRQALDHQRQFNIQEKQEAPEDPTFTIDGVVTRSSGKRTVWLNGVAQNDGDISSGISIDTARHKPGKVTIHAADNPERNASVGDTVNRNTGESTSLIGDGRIEVNTRSSTAR